MQTMKTLADLYLRSYVMASMEKNLLLMYGMLCFVYEKSKSMRPIYHIKMKRLKHSFCAQVAEQKLGENDGRV